MGKKTIFFGGDVCGSLGVATVVTTLPSVRERYNVDFVIVNGENATDGIGINKQDSDLLFDCGVDVISGGNHTLEKFDIRHSFGINPCILRPANYPYDKGSGIVTLEKEGFFYTVINVQGRENMRALDCPFQTVDRLLLENKTDCEKSLITVDFHAESTMEKEALGYYLDGRISLFVGTHTHTQTADERILSQGTGYITDAGMIGAKDSVIGGIPEIAIRRGRTQIPEKFSVAEEGSSIYCGVLVEVDCETKKTLTIQRIKIEG